MDKDSAILEAINEHRGSDDFADVLVNQTYYAGRNQAVDERTSYLERQMRRMIEIKFYKMRTAFFSRAVNRLVMYLMGNGATLDKELKRKVDKKFDKKMIYAYIDACVDGVVWCFVDKEETHFFRIAEDDGAKGLTVLLDERTSKPMVAIRFSQLSEDRPMYIEVYEIDGITEYSVESDSTNLMEIVPKRPYIGLNEKDLRAGKKIPEDYKPNYGVLPFVPLYTNNLRQSRLTLALRESIDARDAIFSDLIDSIIYTEGLYAIIKNYGGSDLNQALNDILEHRLLPVDGPDAMADIKAIAAEFQGKLAVMEQCERDMQSEFMLPNNVNSAGAVNTTEILSTRDEFDTAADMLEHAVADAIEDIFLVKGIDIGILPDYKRRTTINDTAMVDNISTSVSGGWRDEIQAIKDDPTIPTEDKEELIQRIELRDTGVPPDDDELDEEDTEAEEKVEQIAGKTLTGIQTTSLIGVIEKYAAGALTLQQAINIVSVSIGVTAEEARRIIEGLD